MDDPKIKKLKTGIGRNIRRIRLQSEVEVKQICADLEIAPSTYSNLERGVTDMSVCRLIQLAEYFSIPFTRILVPDDVMNNFIATDSAYDKNNTMPPLVTPGSSDYSLVCQQLQVENRYLREQNNKLLVLLEKIR